MPPKRPVLRWHGGKWLLAPWIIDHFGKHRVYVEPFGGAASVLLRKERCHAEVYNDLDQQVVGLFRLLQDSAQSDRLLKLLQLTPFARSEFERSYEPTEDLIEQSRRLIIRSFMGFGSDGCNDARPTGFRANSNRSGTVPAGDWANYSDVLPYIIDRFRSVIVEYRPAADVMMQHDAETTLHYVDPPYLPETRSRVRNNVAKNYRHELTADDHRELLELLKSLSGMVILSGYPSPTYDDELSDWQRVERPALADGAVKRTEVLWLNPAAYAAVPKPNLFQGIRP